MGEIMRKFKVTLVRRIISNGSQIDSSIIVEVNAEDGHDAAQLAENQMGKSWVAVFATI